MNKTQKLKKIILSRYGSISEFSKIVDIPTTTLRSALDKDIGGMAVDRVIKICDILNIDVKTFKPIEDISSNMIHNQEKLLFENFNKLNNVGKNEAIKRVEELTYISKYSSFVTRDCHSYLAPIAAHDDNLSEEEIKLMNEVINKKLKQPK